MILSFRKSSPLHRRLYGMGLQARRGAFSLIEWLATVTLVGLMMGLALPTLSSIQGGEDVTRAAYDLSGALENARAYAIANNTYVWVGFYEEDGSKASANPAIEGVGRVVISAVASKDGTNIYDTSSTGQNPIAAGSLSQLNKLIKIENAHLASFTDGSGTGGAFDARPAAGSNYARIGDANPPTASKFPFQYPVGGGAPRAQYTFVKTIQFNPRGESIINSTYSMRPVVEIGLQPTRGGIVNTNSKNIAAIQITGVGGNVTIYSR